MRKFLATEFSLRVVATLKKIPKGKVATYSQIARLAGNPNGTRGVVWILHSSSSIKNLPWHRVINAKGKISFPEMSPNYLKQKKLLENEGIKLNVNSKIDLTQFQWSK
jgi:methylated-DNA-protein-cysteine methyltransferase-like protein